MTLKVGDVIEVKEKSKSSAKFKELAEKAQTAPNWVSVDFDKLSGSIVALPTREDIDYPVEEHLIIELYSK
jgi:small subunit ribosomal protein S4